MRRDAEEIRTGEKEKNVKVENLIGITAKKQRENQSLNRAVSLS